MSGAACSTTNNRFTITRGVTNSFTFTIKSNGSTLPITIQPTDTFEAHLIRCGSEPPEVVDSRPLTVVDAPSGKVELTYDSTVSASLPTEKGRAEDRFYVKPIHYLVIECNTADNGYITARIDKVYVD